MTKRLRTAFAVLLVGGAICLGGLGQGWALQVGDQAPPFELPASTGEKLKLADYLGKQPVVLFFYIGAFTKT